jgi:uncharacterized OsmC-like protein
MHDAVIRKKQIVNGVNVDELLATVDAIRADREIARFNFRASSKWIGGGRSRTIVDDYSGACQEFRRAAPFVIETDEPPVLLGTDRGANPVECLLAALAGCLTTSLVYHAAARGIEIEEVESTFEGDLDLRGFLGIDETVRNGCENICVAFRIKADAPDDALRELVDLARRRSPVFDALTNGVSVAIRLDA